MPVARFEMPDGRIARFEVPDGTTPEQAQAMMAQAIGDADKPSRYAQYRAAADENSGAANFMAGVGGMMKAPYVGVRQMLGKATPDEVADWKDSMRGLGDTLGGALGTMAGGAVLPVLAGAALPGAATVAGAAGTGALIGALDPVTEGQSRLGNATKGALFNAALPAAIATGMAVKRGVVDPFRAGGQEQIAGRVLNRFASNADNAVLAARNPVQHVPGSQPTLAEATLDPGLATLQETLRSMDAQTAKALLVNRGNLNSSARLDALRKISGSQADYDSAIGTRLAQGKQNYGQAFADGIDQQAAAAHAPMLQNLAERLPAEVVGEAKALAKMRGEAFTEAGSLQGLHYTKLALDTRIANAKGPEKAALTELKNDFMSALDEISPAYRKAVDQWAKDSKPINAMDIGRRLYDKSTSALMEGSDAQRLYPNRFAQQLKDETSLVKQATGKSGTLRSILPDHDIKTLNAIKKDLQRQVRAQELAKVNGSPTAQYLVGQDILRQTIGPVGMPKGVAESAVVQNFLNRPISAVYGVPEQAVRGLLAQAVTDPKLAAGLLAKARQPMLGDRFVGSAGYRLAAPGAGAGLLGLSQE